MTTYFSAIIRTVQSLNDHWKCIKHIQIKCKIIGYQNAKIAYAYLQHTFTNLTDVQTEFVQIFKHDNLNIESTKRHSVLHLVRGGAKAVSNELILTYKVQLTQVLKGNEPSTKQCYKIKFTSDAFFLHIQQYAYGIYYKAMK